MRYFLLEWKRLSKILVFLLLIAALLVSISLVVFQQLSDLTKNDRNATFTISVVGNTDSRLFSAGIAALKTMDPSRYSIDLQLTDEETAEAQLRRGQISAYVVIPKGFSQAADRGELLPIAYYSTTSTIDISALVREEMTKVIEAVVQQSQKGVFGGERLVWENGYKNLAVAKANQLNLKYINFIIGRTGMYKTKITGVSYGMDLMQHLFIGVSIMLLCVLAIPLLCLLVRRDNSLVRLLSANGIGPARSALCEYLAMLLVFLSALFLVAAACYGANKLYGLAELLDVGIDLAAYARALIPVSIMICAFAFAASELSGNLLSAVTGYFFFSMGLCYISGCMYPLYALPKPLQDAAAFTPTGAARAFVALSVTGADALVPALTLCLYVILFLGVAVLARKIKLSKGGA
ncbi:MAG: ABC transporter permease [Oscillospiraceae bacterium]|nr:ABC transporter permease [Oscillospiraceae bacterium]